MTSGSFRPLVVNCSFGVSHRFGLTATNPKILWGHACCRAQAGSPRGEVGCPRPQNGANCSFRAREHSYSVRDRGRVGPVTVSVAAPWRQCPDHSGADLLRGGWAASPQFLSLARCVPVQVRARSPLPVASTPDVSSDDL